MTEATNRPRVGRRARAALLALAVLAVVWVAYVAKFGDCDVHSKFCTMAVAGTRSEVGCEWDSWRCYISTWSRTPATHVLFKR